MRVMLRLLWRSKLIPLSSAMHDGDTMARTVNVGDAEDRLSQLIALAEAGEDVIITRDGVPVSRIVPLERPISETIALMRQERERRPRVFAADVQTAKEQGRS